MAEKTPSPRTGAARILEILRVRCSEATVGDAERSLRELLALPNGPDAGLVRSATSPHDLGLHLRADAPASGPIGPSTLGLHLAESLRDFGPVSHTVWIELDTPTTNLEI